MAIVYKYSDPGVPGYSFSTDNGSQLHFAALKVVLKACLVSGYGSKQPAGWELISEGTDWLTLRNGSHSGYFHLAYYSNGSSSRVDIYVAASFAGVSSPPQMSGVGVVSGNVFNSSAPQRLLVTWLANNPSYHAWTLIADERSFVLSWTGNNSGVVFPPSYLATQISLYAGETTRGDFISVGGTNQASTGSVSARFDTDGVSWLSDPESGLLVSSFTSGSVISHSELLMGASERVGHLPSPAQSLVPVAIFGAMGAGSGALAYAGELRGCCVLPAYSGIWCAQLLQMLSPGSVGNYSGVMEQLPGAFADTGYEFYVRYNRALSRSGLITNHPDYWS